jgi:hypothetical protein
MSNQNRQIISAENGPLTLKKTIAAGGEEKPSRRVNPSSLAQMLIEAGVLSTEQIMKVQEIARRERQSLGRILVPDGLILSRDLATLTAVYLGLTMVTCGARPLTRKPYPSSQKMSPANTWFSPSGKAKVI